MRKIVSIATHHGREISLIETVKSLRNQVDVIYVTANDSLSYSKAVENKDIDIVTLTPYNLADNAKFYPLRTITEDCYFFTIDDDLAYAPDYISNMVDSIEKHECIITHHGRKLKATGLTYYMGHYTYKCLIENNFEFELDVCGTGVTGFKTSYFKPMIWDSKDLLMSDLIFSLEAAKAGKRIILITHKEGHIKQIIDDAGIFGNLIRKATPRQNEMADEIINLKRRKI